MMPWYYGTGSGWLMPLAMVLAMLLFWGGLLVIAMMVLRHFTSGSFHRRHAERVLAERLARGEIDENDYAKVRQVLRTP